MDGIGYEAGAVREIGAIVAQRDSTAAGAMRARMVEEVDSAKTRMEVAEQALQAYGLPTAVQKMVENLIESKCRFRAARDRLESIFPPARTL